MKDIPTGRTRALLGVPELPVKLIQQALTVAGADSNNPDGFKILAQLGTAHIDACILEMGYRTSLSRASISDIKTQYNTTVHRADIARKNGIQNLIEYGKNGKETDNNLAFAMSALLAIVSLERGLDGVRVCLIKLGFFEVGPGLQMHQNYDAVLLERSATSAERVTTGSVQSATATNEQSPSSSVQPRSQTEASSSENGGSPAAIVETPMTSECEDFIPFNLPNDFGGLDLVNCDTGCYGTNRTPVEGIDTARYDALANSGFRESSIICEFSNPILGLPESCAFPVKEGAPLDSSFCQGPNDLDTSTIIREEESCNIADVSGTIRKRKSIEQDDGRTSKRANTDGSPRWAISLRKEMEKCKSKNTALPPEIFFREDIKKRCLALDPRSREIATLILFQIASSHAFVCLRDALLATKKMDQQKHPKVSMRTSMEDRFQILEALDGEITYNALLKRYHLLELFTSCGGAESEDNVFIPYNANIAPPESRRKGHPIRNHCADITQRMMKQTFPSLSPQSEKYESRKSAMKRHRALANRFQTLVNKFGRAILCLIPPCHGTKELNWGISDNKIREISENSLNSFIDVLERSQGNYIREVCKATEPLLQYLFYENPYTVHGFALEYTEAAEIHQLPKGSDELLRLLQDDSGNEAPL